jgi:DNA-binding NtrC family response regulator
MDQRLPGAYGLIGQHPAMRALFAQIARVAAFAVPVLILGESGTGKELVATALHSGSPRRAARFEAVNCGALPRELLLSELFGHERGAFTGAIERRPGLLAAAHGGTVFLDEVGELAPEAQAALLRFLATGEVRAVGATRANRVDVRLIAATHRDVLAAARAGRFREDLYYRLRRVVLRVPPLRDRLADLPFLVEHVRRQVNARHGLTIDEIGPATLRRLAAHPWPGNVRELEAVLEEGMALKGRGRLESGDLRLDPPVSTGPISSGDARHALALQLAAMPGGVTRGQLAATSRISGESARQALRILVQRDKLRRIGRGRGTRYIAPCSRASSVQTRWMVQHPTEVRRVVEPARPAAHQSWTGYTTHIRCVRRLAAVTNLRVSRAKRMGWPRLLSAPANTPRRSADT